LAWLVNSGIQAGKADRYGVKDSGWTALKAAKYKGGLIRGQYEAIR
jgi:hypothetical protein